MHREQEPALECVGGWQSLNMCSRCHHWRGRTVGVCVDWGQDGARWETEVGGGAIVCADRARCLTTQQVRIAPGAGGWLLWCEMIAFCVAPGCTDHRHVPALAVTWSVRLRQTGVTPRQLPPGSQGRGQMLLLYVLYVCTWGRDSAAGCISR